MVPNAQYTVILLRNTKTRNELNLCFMFHVRCGNGDQPYMADVTGDFIGGTSQKMKLHFLCSVAIWQNYKLLRNYWKSV